jgi:hypothetical protein
VSPQATAVLASAQLEADHEPKDAQEAMTNINKTNCFAAWPNRFPHCSK